MSDPLLPPDPTYCVRCKTVIASDAEFCPKCGQAQDRRTAEQIAADEAAAAATDQARDREARRIAEQQAAHNANLARQWHQYALRNQNVTVNGGGSGCGNAFGGGCIGFGLLTIAIVMVIGAVGSLIGAILFGGCAGMLVAPR
jgi:hypothetical protein